MAWDGDELAPAGRERGAERAGARRRGIVVPSVGPGRKGLGVAGTLASWLRVAVPRVCGMKGLVDLVPAGRTSLLAIVETSYVSDHPPGTADGPAMERMPDSFVSRVSMAEWGRFRLVIGAEGP